jgi:hypothetical protein
MARGHVPNPLRPSTAMTHLPGFRRGPSRFQKTYTGTRVKAGVGHLYRKGY